MGSSLTMGYSFVKLSEQVDVAHLLQLAKGLVVDARRKHEEYC
jgi:hypothetical protein